MPGDPRIRASDADRDRAAALLREHHAAGRLTSAEFHDRLDKAMDARTLGELDDLMADLPAIDLYELPDAELRRSRAASRDVDRRGRRDDGPGRRRDDGRGRRRDDGPGLPWGAALVARDGAAPELSAGAAALIAWGTVAMTLVVIALVTGILVGGLSAWWVLAAIPVGAISLIWFAIRRSRR